MYSILNLNYYHYRWVFLESTEVNASEEPNALEKAPAQFMPLWKLSRKFHFLVQFAQITEIVYMCNGIFPSIVWLTFLHQHMRGQGLQSWLCSHHFPLLLGYTRKIRIQPHTSKARLE